MKHTRLLGEISVSKSCIMKISFLAAFVFAGTVTGWCADPVINFDDVPSSSNIPSGYHLLNWSGFQCLDGTDYAFPSGYQAAVQSGLNVIYPASGSFASISGGMYDLLSLYATAAYNDNVQLEAKGYIKGTLVYDQTNTLSATDATLIQYNFYGVDEVDFSSSGGTPHAGYSGGSGNYFAFDDVSVTTYLPYSALLANGGFETGDFSGWSRGGNTNGSTVVSGDATHIHSGTFGAKMGPSLTPGSLGQTITPTDIGQTYTVSFWLANPVGAGPNIFGVFWNGSSILGLTNLPVFAFTNYQFDLIAWKPSEFLQFQFQNDPAWFGFDDVTVTPKVLVRNGGFETGDVSGWTHTGVTNHDQVGIADHLAGAFGAEFGAVNTNSFISQSIATQPGQPYLVSAWLRNFNGNTPVNEFHASWSGQPLLDLTNIPVGGWTNFHAIALNGNPQNTLQFGFRNDPGVTLFDEASVHPIPLLQNAGFELGDFTGWDRSGNLGSTFVSTNKLYAMTGYYGAQFGQVGSLGFISQNVATVPGQSYLIGCTLYVQTPFTNAEFTVSWNGAILMDVTNIGLLGQVPFEFPVTASGTNSVLQFGFRNDPKYFGFDNVFVSPIPAPVLQSISRTNNLVNLSWSALPGYLYDLQYATNLSQTNWTSLRGVQFPTNFPMMGTDTNPPEPRRFYRVRLYPPPLIF
jgi:hypothetical protein